MTNLLLLFLRQLCHTPIQLGQPEQRIIAEAAISVRTVCNHTVYRPFRFDKRARCRIV
ncbi:hypothetical protein D3C80_2030430 [compost metagenome]